MRHQLRHGYVYHILAEFAVLLRYALTPESDQAKAAASPELCKAPSKTLALSPVQTDGIASGIVESACKWLITQRFKGGGMR